ncbi:MAG TPA: hypothetical protein VHC90_11245 [Bryobacteraceae bacterium]|nr:hypothetical protein [Bryobacteraceae bacterium]
MIHRTLVLAGVFAALCFANPETIVFTGTADGDLAGQTFSGKKVTFTFLTDTAAIAPGTYCCTDNITTPAGTQGTVTVDGVGTGTMTYTQGVFVNESEGQMGIWFYDERDYFDILWPVGSYDLKSNYGPVTGTTFVFSAGPMPTTAGVLHLQTMTNASATVTVSPTPEPKPVITSVTAAYGGTTISQNTWIAIQGTNLVSSQTQAPGLSWVGPQPYLGGYMEASLNGVQVSVNGKPAVVSYYCSAAPTGSPCTAGKDQINALVALDSTTGPVNVVVTNGGVASDPFQVTMGTVSPAFLLLKDNQHITATHADYSIIGPTSLYPGASTPASVGETIVLWAVGFGLPSTTLVANADTQSGALPTLPVCSINGAAATVAYAGVVSPGLYQINLVVPNGATNGDNKLSCTYGGASTQSNVVIAVSR